MTSVTLTNVNPIALDAVVTAVGGVYSVETQYYVPPATTVDQINADYSTSYPATVVVNVTSTSVPTGYYLVASGDGSWTTVSSSSLTGVFTVGEGSTTVYSFTISVTNGFQMAGGDPRLVIRKIFSDPPDPPKP